MLSYVSAVGFRYFSIGLQFAIIVLVTRYLPPAGTGSYLLIYGLMTSTYYLAGAGLPDGIVKSIAAARASGNLAPVRFLVWCSSIAGGLISLATASAGAIIGILFGFMPEQTIAAALWWFSYGAVFHCAQCLLAVGRPSLGSFFFYPAANLFQAVFLAVYLGLNPAADVDGVIAASVLSAMCCALAAAGFVVRALKPFPTSPASAPLWPAFSLGGIICVSRVLQSALYWIPVWITGWMQGPAAAGLIAVASRLAVAVASVMAAIRFTIKPEIVSAATRGDWKGIERMGRNIASAATLAALAALIASLVIGEPVIAMAFGDTYAPAALLLSILLVGTIGECFGGPVDEVLRMTDRSHIVLALLAVMTVVESLLIFLLGGEPAFSAASQSVVFVAMYLVLIVYVRAKNGILIVPYPHLGTFLGFKR